MIYLMHGFIGSGKTTRAKELERDLGALRITPDEWMAELFGDDPPADKFRHYQDVLCRRLEPIWTAHARGDANVILGIRPEQIGIDADGSASPRTVAEPSSAADAQGSTPSSFPLRARIALI
ncbi:MAG: AAA family ATPase, partial [Fibrobacterota bacterium]